MGCDERIWVVSRNVPGFASDTDFRASHTNRLHRLIAHGLIVSEGDLYFGLRVVLVKPLSSLNHSAFESLGSSW